MPHFNHRPIPADVDQDLFWSLVFVNRANVDQCWEFMGRRARRAFPYGLFHVGNIRGLLAHRIAYFLATGVDPLGQMVCHRCDNPPCCNPKHLFLGTRENVHDMIQKGREGYRFQNDNSPTRLLTAEQISQIRHRYATEDITHRLLALDFGVSKAAITAILAKRNWKHLAGERISKKIEGEQHHLAKMTAEKVKALRCRYSQELANLQSLADEFGIAFTTAYAIIQRRTWKQVP